jgi:hypothetical protein
MVEHKNLADIVSDIRDAEDPIRHIMVLTYEFDECQLANLVSDSELLEEARISRKQLLEISRIRPIVVYDAAKTKENRSLPQLLELHPWKSRAFGCHHSKAYCLVTNARIHLVLGSFNLTQSGLFRNREVLDYFVWALDGNQSDDPHILRQWTDFLRARYLSRMYNSGLSALTQLIETLEARYRRLPASPAGDISLVFSGYGVNGENGLDTLKALWSRWFPDESPTGLLVVSPFFDQNPDESSIAGDFLSAFPELHEIHICTSEETEPMLGKGHFGPSVPGANHALFLIPKRTGEEERKTILAEAASQHIFISDAQTLERKLHAKVLLLFNGQNGISYAGSANFSRHAWLGRNQELGVARRENDISALRKNIMRGLYIERENRYAALPPSPPRRYELVDDEEEITHERFPEFIEHIVLERCPATNRARFVLHRSASDPGQYTARDYKVTWGIEPLEVRLDEPLEVRLDEPLTSQWIENTEWQKRLVGGRNLAFHHRNLPDLTFWFPFQYSESLINESGYLLNITSSDWLLCHASTQMNSESFGLADYADDVENASGHELDSLAPDREANAVIAMQRYLQQFGDVEDAFRKKVELILKDCEPNADRQDRSADHIKSAVLSPLEMFFTILRKEYAEKSGPGDALPQYAFRLGELLLFILELSKISSLTRGILSQLCRHIEEALHALSDMEQGEDSILRSYLAFVLQGTREAGPLPGKTQ